MRTAYLPSFPFLGCTSSIYINTLHGTNYGCAYVLEIRLNYISYKCELASLNTVVNL